MTLWIVALILACIGGPIVAIGNRAPDALPAVVDVGGLLCASASIIVAAIAFVQTLDAALGVS